MIMVHSLDTTNALEQSFIGQLGCVQKTLIKWMLAAIGIFF